MTNEDVIELVMDELETAERKHQFWPGDLIHAAAIVSEEAGELVRACNNAVWHPDQRAYVDEAYVMTEAIQTAAMAIRFLKHCKIYFNNKELENEGN